MEKEQKLDRQRMHCIAWTQIALSWTTANRKSSFSGHCSRTTMDPAKMSLRSYRFFIPQEIIFAHDDLYPNQPRLRGVFCARRIGFVYEELQPLNARSSPFENSPLVPGAARTSQLRGAPLGASVPASTGAHRRIEGRADSSCSGRTDSICDSEPDLWKLDLDVAGNYCPRVPEPKPQPAVSFPPRLLRELILTHSPSDPRRSKRGSPLTKWLSLREGRAHRVCHHHCPGHCHSLNNIFPFFVGRNISGLSINPTLIPGCAALTSSVPAAFWLSLQPHRHSLRARASAFLGPRQPFVPRHHIVRVLVPTRSSKHRGCLDTGRSVRRQRTRSRLSLGMCPK